MALQRVAITGMGAICGLGHNLNEIWNNLIEGKSGISKIELLNTDQLPVQIAGEIKNFKLSPELLIEKDHDKFDRFIHLALHSTAEAWKQSGIAEEDYKAEKIGCILGTGMGGFPGIETTHSTFMEKGARRVSPFFIPSVIPNMSSGLISIQRGFKGINYTISSACASSAHAIQVAAQEIMLGRQDVMITGGSESVISNLTISGFASMKALSKRNDEPTKASRPFDKDRNGFVMAEGAGILVIENLEKAKARGAHIIAELVGFGASADANHITSPHPEAAGAIQAINQCLEQANVSPNEVGYINAHGTSTPQGDVIETKAIKNVFKDHAYKLVVSSTKSMTGHLLGAAGGLETIICAMALKTGKIPPTINLDAPDAECDLNYSAHKMTKKDFQYALNNSFGFGGTNSSLLLKKI
ncbi:MAG: beta-ketoacyl-ACP synthase II [Bacteriovoracaceae bacterium]|nr:beta-ketoacyl-ACP synthase II [Bacteriovoracaceae bacterium]